jgi:hypothetical protein
LCNHRLAFFTYNARGSNRIINLSDHSLKMWNDMVKSNKRSSQVNDNIIAKPTEAKPCPTNRWYNYITKWHLFSLHLHGETLLEVLLSLWNTQMYQNPRPRKWKKKPPYSLAKWSSNNSLWIV